MTTDISQLPADVFNKVVAYKLGDPKYMRLKYCRAFRRIQVMYKIFNFNPVIEMDKDNEDNDTYAFEIRFSVLRIAINNPLPFHKLNDMVMKQEGKIKELLNKEAIRFEELKKTKAIYDEFSLTIMALLMVKDYNDEIIHDTRQISSNSVQCGDLRKCLNEMSEDLKTYIERQIPPQRIFGLQGFHFQIETQFFKE